MRFAKPLSTVALPAAFTGAAHANTANVKATNATSDTAAFTYEYFSRCVAPSPIDLTPGNFTTVNTN